MTDLRLASLEVSGMTCDDCARHVTLALETAVAVSVSVSWQDGKAQFTWPIEVAETALRAAVSGAGYRPGVLGFLELASKISQRGQNDFDLVALGAGSAAFAAAIKAAEAGYRVALVEKGVIGGTCVNVGCIPSKALLRAGELAWTAGHHPFSGLTISSGPIDLSALVSSKNKLVDALREAKYVDLVADYGFTVLPGHGRFTGPDSLEVDGKVFTASVFLIATGASPSVPPIPGLADSGFLTSTAALELTEIPRSLTVIGANAIGLELGQFFLHIGSAVTFIDVASRIAPLEEPEISAALADVLTAQGATIYTSANVLEVRLDGNKRVIRLNNGDNDYEVVSDQVLVATGRRANTSELGLDAAGVAIDSLGAIVVDDEMRTSNPRIFAAGDVTGGPQFVYVSAYEGALVVDNALLGMNRKRDFTGLPKVTFTAPQIASAGVTEAQARDKGYEVVISVLPLDAVPRALVNREVHGLLKLVAEANTGRLLGASLLADGAGDVIQAAVLAIKYGLTVNDLASTFHPYLTMAEGLKLAAQTFSRDVNRLSCCAA